MGLQLSTLKSSAAWPLPILLIYGVPKVGKTSLALEFPDVLYVPTAGESPPAGVNITSTPVLEDFDDLIDTERGLFIQLLTQEHPYKTVVIDSLDGLEPLEWDYTCRNQPEPWASIESPGYGKGYIEADAGWRRFIRAIEMLAGKGITVIMLAHHEIYRFDSPTSEPFSRYGIKLHKRASAIVQEASSLIGFLNFRTEIKTADVGFNKKVARSEGGGDRELHVEERPGFTAGNRYPGMPPSLLYRQGNMYAQLARYIYRQEVPTT